MDYQLIATDVRERIEAETKARLACRRAFLEMVIADAGAAMEALDAQRLSHFVSKITAEAELRDMSANGF